MDKNHIYDLSRWVAFACVFVLIWFRPVSSEAQSYKIVYPKDGTDLYLPFTYVNGFIVVDVLFQKVIPMKFIVDTGASNTLLLKKEYVDVFNMSPQRRLSVQGADLVEYLAASIYNGIYLKVSEMPHILQNIIVLDEDFTQFEALTGMRIDGILGADYFRNMILGIDYVRHHLIIYNPNKFNPDKMRRFRELDIEVYNNKPYVRAYTEIVPNQKTEARLLIDSGASLGLLLHQNTDTLISIPDKTVLSVLGKGLGGDILGYTGRIHHMQWDDLEFSHLITHFQAIDTALTDLKKVKRNGILGNHILERFHVIFDFRWNKLYLKPHKKYNHEVSYDKSGLSIITYGAELDQFMVRYVVEGSPAEKSDIRPGDIIVKIGCLKSQRYSLNHFLKKLSGKSGKKIRLKVLRGEETMEKIIVLQEYI